MLVKILHQNCDKSLANNKNLPRNSYLIGYLDAEEKKFDIVQSNSKVKIFDHYYDEYRNIISIDWTNGTINPKTYDFTKPEKRKK